MACSFRPAAFPILLCVAIQILLFAPNSAAAGNLLKPGETLLAGKCLSIGNYHLAMQHNCNLELYHGQNLTWESHTSGMGTRCFLYMQVNGDLAIFSQGTSSFVWISGTGGGDFHSFVLVLQSDGNAVVYGTAVWSTGTVRAAIGGNASTDKAGKVNP